MKYIVCWDRNYWLHHGTRGQLIDPPEGVITLDRSEYSSSLHAPLKD